MNRQAAIKTFYHRPLRVGVQYPKISRKLIGFIEEDEGYDNLESEIKHTIVMFGSVTPQYEQAPLETCD